MLEAVVLIGESLRREEWEAGFDGFSVVYQGEDIPENLTSLLPTLIIDLNLDDSPQRLSVYNSLSGITVLGCAVKKSLTEMVYENGGSFSGKLFGINSLPTFIHRPRLEVSLYNENDEADLKSLCEGLGKEFDIVQDRVGMIVPRVLSMIINEACIVLQEGTASIKDVDQAMQLGTNYPGGPFTWADNIGIMNVYETLSRMQDDSGQGRYKVAPLLKEYALKGKRFYS